MYNSVSATGVPRLSDIGISRDKTDFDERYMMALFEETSSSITARN